MDNEIPTFYTAAEAEEILKVTRRSLYRYITSGKLKATKTASGQWRIAKKDLLEFMRIN